MNILVLVFILYFILCVCIFICFRPSYRTNKQDKQITLEEKIEKRKEIAEKLRYPGSKIE